MIVRDPPRQEAACGDDDQREYPAIARVVWGMAGRSYWNMWLVSDATSSAGHVRPHTPPRTHPQLDRQALPALRRAQGLRAPQLRNAIGALEREGRPGQIDTAL